MENSFKNVEFIKELRIQNKIKNLTKNGEFIKMDMLG